jgi:hypothetical protein
MAILRTFKRERRARIRVHRQKHAGCGLRNSQAENMINPLHPSHSVKYHKKLLTPIGK